MIWAFGCYVVFVMLNFYCIIMLNLLLLFRTLLDLRTLCLMFNVELGTSTYDGILDCNAFLIAAVTLLYICDGKC